MDGSRGATTGSWGRRSERRRYAFASGQTPAVGCCGLRPAVRDDIERLLAFPENTAGRLMERAYVGPRATMTVQEALQRLQDSAIRRARSMFVITPEQRLAGRVLLVHHASLELRFLQRLCRSWYDTPLIVHVVDTQVLARRRFERHNRPYRAAHLRLANLRAAYGLPRYRAHHALSDALATAELFLAMLPEGDCRLKDVLTGD